MRLSWNEIRARAKAFAADHADDRNEIADTQTFYNDFFRIFDIDRKRVAIYERSAERINRAMDLPGKCGEHQLRNQEVFYGKRE